MMKKAPSQLLTALLTVAVVLLIPRVGETGETAARAEITRSEEALRAMITALLANDYAAFLSPGSKDLASQISEQRFAIIREDAGPALKNGYTLAFDIEVPESAGSTSYHWKITPRRGDGELRAILVSKRGKVSNLSIQ